MPSFEGSVEQQDSRGWTPIMWASSNAYSLLVKQVRLEYLHLVYSGDVSRNFSVHCSLRLYDVSTALDKASYFCISSKVPGNMEQQGLFGAFFPLSPACELEHHCCVFVQLLQRNANVNHMGQAKSGSGTTMALHECAAMRGDAGQSQEAYFETAWLLMSAGASPFAERSDGELRVSGSQRDMPQLTLT